MVVFNLAFIAAVYFGTKDLRNHQETLQSQLIDSINKNHELIGRCMDIHKPGG